MKLKDEDGWYKTGWVISFILLCTALVILAAGLISWAVESHACRVAQGQYGKHTHYYLLGGGCYIESEPGIKVGLGQYQHFHMVGK